MNKKLIIPSAVILFLIAILGCDDDPTTVDEQKFSIDVDSSFAVGNFPALAIENFVGNVSVKSGATGVIIISATKWAEREGDLSKITIEMNEVQSSLYIVADNPSDVKRASVDFEITVPPDARVTVHNGVGNTNYRGPAGGESHFDTGVGSIRLNLPSNINVGVELSVGVGTIFLDFPVSGQISQHAVGGVIGTGADGKIYAEVGVGSLRLNRQ